ncbi:MAG: prenyltransferase/squalene oxidase repeat-containing protein [Thermoguttaceae bacterium]|jgi:squalene-hopene/tetraprenyl-beta-curcumene cyclase
MTIDFNRLLTAYQTARRDLLALREPSGHWVGELSASALSTATAASALSIVARHEKEESRREAYRQLAERSIDWLSRCQNDDGGWGDTNKSYSNIATTMLVQSAFHLANRAAQYGDRLGRSARYVEAEGGLAGLRRRYGRDRTFAAPILANCALAGLVPWWEVPQLPFELACLPHPLLRLLRLPVVSYAIPALVAIGQMRLFHRWPRNPLAWLVRRLCVRRSLKVLRRMQPPSGGFLEAIPLTSFVVMGLASTGRAAHAATRRGVGFLLDTVRADASWPIDRDLAVWNTTLAIQALSAASGDVGALGCLDWLLESQHRSVHPFTHAAPGGWGWSDSSGAVPDADDTAGALLALAVLLNSGGPTARQRIESAARSGVDWLLAIENADGGWPSFCRGWAALPFDRSAPDLTAHALRALHAWQHWFVDRPIDEAIRCGLRYLALQQRPDGFWLPLWFGNQHYPGEENPVYGTARVLLAYRDLGLIDSEPAARGLQWLTRHADPGGGWGGGIADGAATHSTGRSSVEETALAVEALAAGRRNDSVGPTLKEGINWLIKAVAQDRHWESAPLGLYFAKLWYYERVYPLAFTVAALGQAVKCFSPAATSGEDGQPPPE